VTALEGGAGFSIDAGGKSGADAVRALAGQGLFPAEVVKRRQSLEAVFIELTGDHEPVAPRAQLP
jgi:hypothetical protein